MLITTATVLQKKLTRKTDLSLRIIEVSWYSDDSILDSSSQIILSCFFHLHENKCSNLTWWIHLTISFKPCITIGSFDNLKWHAFPKMYKYKMHIWQLFKSLKKKQQQHEQDIFLRHLLWQKLILTHLSWFQGPQIGDQCTSWWHTKYFQDWLQPKCCKKWWLVIQDPLGRLLIK